MVGLLLIPVNSNLLNKNYEHDLWMEIETKKENG